MHKEELKKEQHLLSQMRNTLSNVVKDITPPGGNTNPLTNSTMREIMDCFDSISKREKELTDKLGSDQAKPDYADNAQPGSSALNFVKLPKVKR
jgi:hypothetical protein